MLRFKKLSVFLMNGTAIILSGLLPMKGSLADSPTYPKTVQVKPGGASIHAQPKSSGEVIGEYNAGVILNPTLRVFSTEGQIWLKIGDHWVPDASIQVIEDSATPAATTPSTPSSADAPVPSPDQPPADTSSSTPAATPPSSPPPIDASPPAPAGKPLSVPPTAKAPQTAVVTAKDPDVAINIRAQPSTESESVLAVKPGEQGEVLQQKQGKDTYTWYKLKFAKTGTEGWMRGDFVQLQSAKSPLQSAASPTEPENPGSITAPSGISIVLQTTPAQQTATQYQANSGQKVEILSMAKGEDGFAWYSVQFVDKAEAKGWVRGDQVRFLANFTPPRLAKLSAPASEIIKFYAESSEQKALSIRGISGSQVEVLKQAKGDNGYAWYSVKVVDKPSAQGWVKGENLRLNL